MRVGVSGHNSVAKIQHIPQIAALFVREKTRARAEKGQKKDKKSGGRLFCLPPCGVGNRGRGGEPKPQASVTVKNRGAVLYSKEPILR